MPARLHERLGPELRILRVAHFGAKRRREHGPDRRIRQNPHVDAVLVDSRTVAAVGGTGVAFDWVAAREALFQDAKSAI